MVLGKEEPKKAENRCWKDAIRIALDEALTALEESFYDLTDEQVGAYPLPDRHNIATIAMHVLANLDEYAVVTQAGQRLLPYEERFDMWRHSPAEPRPLQTNFPSVREMVDHLHRIRDAAFAALDAATEDDLRGPRAAVEWCRQHDRTSGDAYLRTICHAHAHVRQIWMLRGVLGLSDRDGWPVQHWA